MFCLNLCELFNSSVPCFGMDENSAKRPEWVLTQRLERIYIGSNFCSQYFLNFKGWEFVLTYCRKMQLSVTLVVPVFSEKDLKSGKARIHEILTVAGDIIDEVTVNDIGMLSYVHENFEKKINLGRLFFKDPRDSRVPDYSKRVVTPYLINNLNHEFWKQFDIHGIELDQVSGKIDLSGLNCFDLNIAFHSPLCYMTAGNVCKYASIHKRPEYKFRPNVKCGMECQHITDYYTDHIPKTDVDVTLMRIGRTVYYQTETAVFIGRTPDRIIYFPYREWRIYRHEHSRSLEPI